MPSLQTVHRRSGQVTLVLGLLSIAVAATMGMRTAEAPVEARLVRRPPVIPWAVIDEADILSGAIIPASTNVVFHLPLEGFDTIDREVLLGQKGEHVRYWGYCFPQNTDPDILATTRSQRKGKLFLSEQERRMRAEEAQANRERFSLNNLPTKEDVRALQYRPFTEIRHQMDVFDTGHLCYIMTAAPLAIALDTDGDRLNNKVEREIGTDETLPDTDADGIYDSVEYLTGTDPLLRDSDQDGLIDGIEDANWNGRVNRGETDPRTRDSDRDGLCDGLCRVRLANKQEVYIGEDTNLNGQVDEGETDPRKVDTDGDGVFDEQELLLCLLKGGTDCSGV